MATHRSRKQKTENVECRTIFKFDFWPLVVFLFQTNNNSCAHYILSLSDRDFFDLPLPPFLPAQAQHRPLIDTDRFYPSSARPKKLCTLLLNLNLPGRTFYEVPGILPAGRPKSTNFINLIYTKWATLSSREIFRFELFILFSAPSNKIWKWSKTEVEVIAEIRLWRAQADLRRTPCGGYSIFVTVHGANMPILSRYGWLGQLYRKKLIKKAFAQQQKLL